MPIGYIDILPALFEKVILPVAVRDELGHPKAPFTVRNWVAALPPWVDVRQTSHPHDASLETLDAGEEAAIALAVELHADLMLMDDEEGVIAARAKGLEVTGTLGVLSRAAQRQLLNLAEAFDRVKRTNFRYRREIMDQFLAEQAKEQA
jgi:predicted nucleic acid-binding protein